MTHAPTPRVDHLDGWRGLAILLVLQSHFLPLHGFDSGRMGVDLFFGLSGLLMGQLLFVQRVPLARFYKRRISRIVPAFLLLVISVFGMAAWRGDVRSALEIAATLCFLRTYVPAQPDIWHMGLPLGHLWSLNVEEHCYVFLSLLTLPAWLRGRDADGPPRRLLSVLLLASLCCMALYWLYARSPLLAHTTFEVRTEVAAPLLLLPAAWLLLRQRMAPRVKPWMPVALLGLAALSYRHGSHWWESAIVSPLALACCVNHLGQAPRWLLWLLRSPPLRRLGLCSYSIYLWQQPFFLAKATLPPGVALLGSLAAGLASFHIVENPLRNRLNAHW